MEEKRVSVFFYGLFMDFEILREHGLVPERWEVARLHGYEFEIASWGYLRTSDRQCVYGIVVPASERELAKLYDKTSGILTAQYFPEPVLVETLDGKWIPALCYVATSPPEGPVNTKYANAMVKLAERFKFPEWYVEHLSSFSSVK